MSSVTYHGPDTLKEFVIGNTFEFDHIAFRIVKGIKLVRGAPIPGDMRLEAWVEPGIWFPLSFKMVMFLVQFCSQNEDNRKLHEPTWRKPGWVYFFEGLQHARVEGHEVAAEKVARERRERYG